MALNINGTTGISGVDGSASAPALTGTDSNTGINFASDTVNINTGGSTRATIDSNGRLGIGTSSPSYKLDISQDGGTFPSAAGSTVLRLSNSAGSTTLSIDANAGNVSAIQFGDTDASSQGSLLYNHSTNHMQFNTSDTERMRIDSSGKIGIGTSSPDRLLDVIKGGTNVSRFQQTTNNQGEDHTCITLRHAAATSGQNGVGMIFQNTGGSVVGKIDFGHSTTQYRTSSDYRLKENAVTLSDGITRLKTLKPYRFNFKIDPSTTFDGFFAHEVTAVPEAISGTKDEVDADNNPIYQGIDQSKLVPLLTAALQEAVAKIEVLETKVAALEAG